MGNLQFQLLIAASMSCGSCLRLQCRGTINAYKAIVKMEMVSQISQTPPKFLWRSWPQQLSMDLKRILWAPQSKWKGRWMYILIYTVYTSQKQAATINKIQQVLLVKTWLFKGFSDHITSQARTVVPSNHLFTIRASEATGRNVSDCLYPGSKLLKDFHTCS